MKNKLLITLIFILVLVFSFACARPNGLVGPAGADKIRTSDTSLNDRAYRHGHWGHVRR